jgi:serine protease Do
MQGEVIGINSVKIASIGVEGMGYAISINEAIPVIEELIKSD